MNIEYMLALRTARSDRHSRAAVMMRIASLSVAIGLGVMIITLSIIGGFRYEIHSDLRGFAADIVVSDIAAQGSDESQPLIFDRDFVAQIEAMPEVESVARYALRGGMAKSGDNVCGLQLKGVGSEYDLSWWQEKLIEGEMPKMDSEERHKEILLSQTTAQKLGLQVGDKLEMLFTSDDARPRRDRFKVAGLYNTGFEEMDCLMALADIRDVQRIFGWGDDEISGYDIMLKPAEQSYVVAEQLEQMIFDAYDDGDDQMARITTATLASRNPVVFDWLKAHDMNATVISVIMMTVLLLNMTSAMLIMVLDRTGMIGLLKAQGMRNSAVRRIFLWRAALLFLRGAAWGNGIALLLVGVQWLWQPIKLDPSGYMLAVLPVRVELWWLLLLNAGVLLATLLMMILPSFIVARIHPDQTLKYKQ